MTACAIQTWQIDVVMILNPLKHVLSDVYRALASTLHYSFSCTEKSPARRFCNGFHYLRAAATIGKVQTIVNDHYMMYAACAKLMPQLCSSLCCTTSTHMSAVLPNLQQALCKVI